ncbi:MAG: type II toxin-antitoxin system VapC family toxin [Candidatus Methanomethylicia archaeon]
MKLFDSSAIINICGRKRLDQLLEGWTLNLAFYELGNAVWKQVYLYRTLDLEKAKLVLNTLIEIFNKMRKINKENTIEILNHVVKNKITYYDAAYLQAAIDNNLILVTDDEKLYNISKKYVNVVTSDEL